MMKSNMWKAILGSAVLAMVPACGDDGGGSSDDGGGTDAGEVDCDNLGPHDEVPPECEVTAELSWPEGGEVRFEYMEWPADCGEGGDQGCGPGGRTTATRLMSFAMTAMNPERFPLPPEVNSVTTCASLVDKDVWPLGQGANRVYGDMGTVTVGSTGVDDLVVAPADPMNPDALGRSHDYYNFYFGMNDTDTYVAENVDYDVSWTGSSSLPAGDYPASIYLPGAYTLTSPPFQSGVQVVNNADFVNTWGAEGNDVIPDGRGGMLSLVAIAVPGVGVTHLCAGPDSGSITVPADLVAEAAELAGETGGALLLRGKLTHQLEELQSNDGATGRRLDMLGIWCYLQGITFVDPT